jgi:hypothetical protein
MIPRRELTSRPQGALSEYVSEHDGAPELGQKVRTLRLWRLKGTGPAWTKVGRKIFYRRPSLMSWLAGLERKPVRSALR